MKDFLRDEAVLVCEEPRLQELALEKLSWSRNQWWDRLNGRVKLKPAERMILSNLLAEVRAEAEEERAHANNI